MRLPHRQGCLYVETTKYIHCFGKEKKVNNENEK